MIKPLRLLILVLAIFGAFLAGSWYSGRSSSNSAAAGKRVLRYICPMHPHYVSDKPGTAPCCGMSLEPVYADGTGPSAGAAAPIAGALTVSPEQQQLMGIRTGVVEMSSVNDRVRIPGRVAPDETRTYRVDAAVDGWVREVFTNSTGDFVEKDEALATFYSKDFLPAQQNYFYALNTLDRLKKTQFQSTTDQITLTNVQVWSNEDALESLGMGRTQIQEIANTRQYARSIVLRAPTSGFVLARNISPGQRLQRGQELYRIADLSRVWILADLFERDGGQVPKGQQVVVRYRQSAFPARVSEVLPQFDADSRTLKLRLEMDNPGFTLRPDMFVDVELPVNLPAAPTAPVDAVLDTGLKKTVFVDRGEGRFEPRTVETAWRFGDRVAIAHGLEAGERIVISGNFLLDSESRMKPIAIAAAPPAAAGHKDPVCGMDVDAATAKHKSEHAGKTIYFCSGDCKKSFDKNPGEFLK